MNGVSKASRLSRFASLLSLPLFGFRVWAALTSWRHCLNVPPSALFLAFSPQFFRPAWRRAAQWSGGKVFGELCERGWKSFHAEVYRGLAHSGAPVIIAKARASWIFIKTAAP
jgi:hypothetical protein